MLLDMLAVNEHQVVVARNGREAVEMAQQHRPELVLMDIRMPVMNGLQAARRIHADPNLADVPIIGLTAGVGADVQAGIRQAGLAAGLPKPIQSEERFEMMDEYLQPQEVTR